MTPTERVRAQLPHTLRETQLPHAGELYRGKVRDVYRQPKRLLLVTTDRISAFDHVLGTVPFKGELLTRLAAFWFEKTRDVCKSHLLDVPDPNVLVGRPARALPVEVVVRGYLTGSLWRDVQAGKQGVYGVPIPDGMKKDQAFERPIITPSTKEAYGKHDEPISAKEIVARGLVDAKTWDACCERALALFAAGQAWARTRGLILVDTKYEFGLDGDELLVIDEIHTMDSSRYWEAAEYEARFTAGSDQKMLDKENIRQWLIREKGFSGHGAPPALDDAIRSEIALTYIKAFERITGEGFTSAPGEVLPRLEQNLKSKGYLG
jgi:phosphoribosylaminoimidazole-succinocarboxamide synthase